MIIRTTLALLAIATPALATATTLKMDPKVVAEFNATDANQDGVLSRDEVAARVRHMHVGKGVASPAQVKTLTDLWFTRADANHDEKVTLPEMQRLMIAVAARYDTNHDGVVSRAEQHAAQTKMLAEAKQR